MTSLIINHIFATMTCYQHFVSRKYTIGYFVRHLNDQFLFSEFRHHILKMVLRTESESSDFADLELAGVEPLTLDDIIIGESYVNTQTVRSVTLY